MHPHARFRRGRATGGGAQLRPGLRSESARYRPDFQPAPNLPSACLSDLLCPYRSLQPRLSWDVHLLLVVVTTRRAFCSHTLPMHSTQMTNRRVSLLVLATYSFLS